MVLKCTAGKRTLGEEEFEQNAVAIAIVAVLAGILIGFSFATSPPNPRRPCLSSATAKTPMRSPRRVPSLPMRRPSPLRVRALNPWQPNEQKTIDRLTAERDVVREALQAKSGEASEQRRHASPSSIRSLRANRKTSPKRSRCFDGQDRRSPTTSRPSRAIFSTKIEDFLRRQPEGTWHAADAAQEQIKEFREKVEQAQTDSKTGVTKLETLVGTLNSLNQQLSEEARNLTTALRGSSKTQGDWGNLFCATCLKKPVCTKASSTGSSRRFTASMENGERSKSVRTDVIVFLPGGRNLVIDSKVSLTAYTDWVSAADDDARKAALKLHLPACAVT